MKRERFYLLIFILAFFFAISFLTIKSYAYMCCCYRNTNGQCTDCSTYGGSTCPDSAVCKYAKGKCPCNSDSDCGTCGSGDCQGYFKCENGVCTTKCNSDGRSCTYYCPIDQCQGYKWCDYPDSVKGTCSGQVCTGTCNCKSLSCNKDKCGAPCTPGDLQSCDYCNGTLHCTGTKNCTSDCTWNECIASSCKCETGYCGGYYKTNPWSGKWACCDSSTDCVDYNGNCVDSGSWGNGNNDGPKDHCEDGEWRLGHCAATNKSSTCHPVEYLTDTSGCEEFTYWCPPYDFKIVIPGEVPYKDTTTIPSCNKDDDCKGYDPVTHTKYVCECPDSSKCSITGNSYTCKPKGSCSAPSDCVDGWCCSTPDIGGGGTCQKQGTIKSYQGKSYLCDPPGFTSSVNKQLTLLDFLLKFNPFSKVFS